MFKFFTRADKNTVNFSNIGVDMHSHLIPGIDDGAKTVEDSIALIRGLQDLGFEKLITTPHVYEDLYPNSKDDILRGLSELKTALKAENIIIPIEASAEYFMDEYFLDKQEILPLSGKYVLVEMSFFGAPPELESYIFKIQLKGYTPILAHPERYRFYHNDYTQFRELKEKGVLFQLNAMSLMGYYGKAIQQIAQKLVQDKMIDLIGTDVHHLGHVEYIKSNIMNKEFQQLLSKYEFQNAAIFSA